MAKDRSDTTENTEVQPTNEQMVTTEQPTQTQAAAAPQPAAVAAAGNANVRMVKLTKPLSAATQPNPLNLPAAESRPVGTSMARKDFIRHRWAIDRVGRGQITKDLNEMNTIENGGDGKKVAYQVVFAVIKKGTPGGPVAPEAGSPEAQQQNAA